MTQKKAFVFVRDAPHYRRDAFVGGLQRLGYKVVIGSADHARPGDLMLTWNRYWDRDQLAKQVERAGGLVIVAENGYLGQDGQGRQNYALACHGHNGSGWWPDGGPERFAALGIEPKPWRERGDFVYVRGQRGIGSPSMASPPDWHRRAAEIIRKHSGRKVVVAEHPGKPACEQGAEIAGSLKGAHACVIWSSAVGVRALVEGVPVVYDAPKWICEGAARRGVANVEDPLTDDAARLRALGRMAWAQWTLDEIGTGEPFSMLVDCDRAQRGLDPASAVAA